MSIVKRMDSFTGRLIVVVVTLALVASVFYRMGQDANTQTHELSTVSDSLERVIESHKNLEDDLQTKTDAVIELMGIIYQQNRADSIPRELLEELISAADAHGIPAPVAYLLVETESAFDSMAVSSADAIGLTQVLPSTAKRIWPGLQREDLFNSRLNLHLGFYYLSTLVERFDGNYRLALLGYNRGPNRVAAEVSQGRDPANGYAAKILVE